MLVCVFGVKKNEAGGVGELDIHGHTAVTSEENTLGRETIEVVSLVQ